MKKALLFVLPTLLGLLFVPTANAQVLGIPGMAGPNSERFVRQAYAPVDRIIGALGPGDYYGGSYGPGFGGNHFANIIGGIAGGGGIGYLVGGRNGALIGAGAVGGVVGIAEYAANRSARGPKPRDCSKKKNDKKCDAAMAEAQAQAELAERQRLGKRLFNSTRWPVQVMDCDQTVVGQLRPLSNAPALEAKCGYVGVILTPDPSTPGRTQRYQAAFRLTDDAASGWVFRAPANLGGAQ